MRGNAVARSRTLAPHPAFRAFVEDELLPELGLAPNVFWATLDELVEDLTPENRALLRTRDALAEKIDRYHRDRAGQPWDADEYRRYLTAIGYLEPRGAAFRVDTRDVDPEIAELAGPQLVVPVSNPRFAINAANARWGSLYDALYGSDAIAGERRPGDYDPERGAAVIDYAARFLDAVIPLPGGSHRQPGEALYRASPALIGTAQSGTRTSYLFRHHGLHIEIQVDPVHPVGRAAPGHVSDVVLEAAVTTIQDAEDSVAAVDAEDKVNVYRNWLGLMRGTLCASFDKDGRSLTRRLATDREYVTPAGEAFTLPGRSLMLVRNVGHLMTSDAVLDADGNEVFEGILDAVVTVGCALHDLRGLGRYRNSRTGSIYIVKPKMHGSREVAFAGRLFDRVEAMYGLAPNTVKIGVMDEERRTSLNLEECIRAVRHRIVFINTGFLDRTGDEIHTSLYAGPVRRKDDIKGEPWIDAYERRNVDVGLRCGLPGHAQIGKGMWPKPDEMKAMLASKQAHLEAGASCAWVPSPTAATLHAMHYHRVNVSAVQAELGKRPMADVDAMLQPPLARSDELSAADVQHELDTNAQGILGYVVRWIDSGIGCSKVPDLNDVGLMEDRATLRISSQHIANWLLHGVCTEDQVLATFRRIAALVDAQNAGTPGYTPMAPGYDGIAFRTACDLVLLGAAQPNGYTEPLLHARRREKKAASPTR